MAVATISMGVGILHEVLKAALSRMPPSYLSQQDAFSRDDRFRGWPAHRGGEPPNWYRAELSTISDPEGETCSSGN